MATAVIRADVHDAFAVTMTDSGARAALLAVEALHAGSLLGGRYRIRRFIAAGGMGEVYEADDLLLGEPVAIKLLRRELVKKHDAQQRFADEIRLARRVTHHNVSRVFDAGVDGSRVFFTMELFPGQTLQTYLRAHGPLSTTDAAPIARQILAALSAAHAADVIHADLKLSNVLIAPSGRVVVTDFGLALPCCATIGCPCSMPHLVGTPAYMAPEQVTGGVVQGATDLFSFGVILYELLTGKLPWTGGSALAMANARLEGPTPSPRALRPDLDPVWDEVIRACLQVDPRARPRDPDEVARRLGL
jgi:serine/threonine-protein kinase